MAYGLKWLWTWKASAIALVAILMDAALHYALPEEIAIREGLPYFVTKFAVVEISAAVILAMKLSPRLTKWKPFLVGFVGASVFGAIYYYLPWISVNPGYFSIEYRLLWGVFHALVIWIAAAALTRKPRQVYIAAALLAIAIAVGAIFAMLAPSAGY